jgi:hypothetical protein
VALLVRARLERCVPVRSVGLQLPIPFSCDFISLLGARVFFSPGNTSLLVTKAVGNGDTTWPEVINSDPQWRHYAADGLYITRLV